MSRQANNEITMDRGNILAIEGESCAPKACAVSPLVLMRRNPKVQYSILINVPPTEMAHIKDLSPKCPAIAKSTKLSNGIVMLVAMAGRAIFRILLFIHKEYQRIYSFSFFQ